jgi:ribonuclease BN (tRNA processing enzyme)
MATLHMLGAGTPQPTAELWGSAYALEFDDHVVMVDCGPAATHKLLRSDLWITDVEWLFFTHHHSDHNSDYPTLMLFRWDQTTDEPALKVIGPPPTVRMTAQLFGPEGVYADDIRARIEDPASEYCHTARGGSLPRPGPAYEARDVEPGAVIEGPGWTAACARSQHMQPLLWPLAWRFDWDGGSICFTGDTARSDEVGALAEGAHTIVANAPVMRENLNKEFADCIYSTVEAAELARDAGAHHLVLTHLGGRIAGHPQMAIDEMARVYDGEITVAREGLALEV